MKDLMKRRRIEPDAGDGEPSPSPPPARDRSMMSAEPRSAPPSPRRGGPNGSAGRRINPALSTAAIAEARNALAAAQTSGDYRYQSVADLVRAALGAHAGGLRLTQQARNGKKKRHTVELPAELAEHYGSLPRLGRGVIIERALLSFLARGLDG